MLGWLFKRTGDIEESTRSSIALWVVRGFVGGTIFLAVAMLLNLITPETFKDLVRTWAAVFGTATGFVFGYYFRGNELEREKRVQGGAAQANGSAPTPPEEPTNDRPTT